jgi:hypothetical protein
MNRADNYLKKEGEKTTVGLHAATPHQPLFVPMLVSFRNERERK